MTAQKRIESLQKLINVILMACNRKPINADGIIGPKTLKAFGDAYNLNRVQVIQTFANMHHESGGFTIGRESMYYTTTKRLMEIFGEGRHSAKITLKEAPNLLRKSYALAERVYGLGNPKKAKELGNTKIGDGYKYRGGGALQLTGGGAYKKVSEIIHLDIYNNPDLINNEAYFTSAFAEFQYNNIWNKMVNLTPDNIRQVRRIINGGLNGIVDVFRLIEVYKKLFDR